MAVASAPWGRCPSLAGYLPESGTTRTEPWGARCQRALILAILKRDESTQRQERSWGPGCSKLTLGYALLTETTAKSGRIESLRLFVRCEADRIRRVLQE